ASVMFLRCGWMTSRFTHAHQTLSSQHTVAASRSLTTPSHFVNSHRRLHPSRLNYLPCVPLPELIFNLDLLIRTARGFIAAKIHLKGRCSQSGCGSLPVTKLRSS